MNAQLIYDIGAHLGEDTDFYLKKGFKVVAIEANPFLAEGGSSGLFGQELPGKWLTRRQAIQRYRIIFFMYYFFGDFGVLRVLVRVRGLRRFITPQWYDTHATL